MKTASKSQVGKANASTATKRTENSIIEAARPGIGEELGKRIVSKKFVENLKMESMPEDVTLFTHSFIGAGNYISLRRIGKSVKVTMSLLHYTHNYTELQLQLIVEAARSLSLEVQDTSEGAFLSFYIVLRWPERMRSALISYQYRQVLKQARVRTLVELRELKNLY